MQRPTGFSPNRSQLVLAFAFLTAALALAPGCGPGAPMDMAPCESSLCNGKCDVDDDCVTLMKNEKKCDVTTHVCVACLADVDCPAGQVCGPTTHTCAPGCSANKACAGDGGVCEVASGQCVQCLSDNDCPDKLNNPTCDPASRRCFPCIPSADKCPKNEFCATTGTGPTKSFACAAGCKTDTDCPPPGNLDGGTDDGGAPGNALAVKCSGPKPTSGARPNQCVQCLADSDCAAGKVCNQLGFCADGCNANQKCPNGLVCCPGAGGGAGLCVDSTKDTNNCGACGNVCAAGSNCCNSGCSDPLADANNCGGCGIACTVANGTPNCKRATCGVAFCNLGFADCNGLLLDGCETSTDTNVANCGSCNNVCNITNAKPKCAALNGPGTGSCQVDTCFAPYGDCDKRVANGCEVDLSADPINCSACGAACSTNHIATPACQNSLCVGACDKGFSDCNNDRRTDGCESATGTDTLNCGSCRHVCSTSNGTPACTADRNGIGQCSITCNTLFADCNSDVSDGCETSLRTLTNCGTCGTLCSLANSNPNCSDGTCQITTCATGWTDCNKMPVDGCEVHTAVDVMNCGGCSTVCSSTNGTPSCVGGTCFISCASNFADCDHNAGNGCEISLNTDVNNCSACGRACTLPHVATNSCVAGACIITNAMSCQTGWADCNGIAADGCEVDLTADANNCGACSAACSRANDVPACVNRVCKLTCNFGFADCDMAVANGCEVNTGTDPANCGVCSAVCSTNNVIQPTTCAAGQCNGNCSTGFADCNANKLSDGCEVAIGTDVNNCGACGHVCSTANATSGCTNGGCTVTCSAGFGNCDNDVSNGCETALNTNINCGGCGTTCTLPNATSNCASRTCAITTCAAGYADCDSAPANGCEVRIATDVSNCGSCAHACSSTNGTASCSAGTCAIVCSTGFGNCDGDVTNGCETVTSNNAANCGGCGIVCSTANGTAACANGACSITCAAGFGDCDADVRNGCETALNSNTNCGTCGTTCSLTHANTNCASGTCAITTCAAGYADCDAAPANGCEVTIATDVNNCGACANACSSTNGTATCASGTCGIVCNSGFGNCDGNAANGCEVALTTSLGNCGRCGNICSSANGTASCTAGACSIGCANGFGDCDGNVGNGCEATLTTITNCGACGQACVRDHATTQCASQTCAIATCEAGWADCDGSPTNGCEVHIAVDPAHCGGCSTVCNASNGTATCASGTCGITCSTGFANCNNNAVDGCEVHTAVDQSNCGTCGNVCSNANGAASCAAGACSIACTAGFGNCDGNVANGCETSLATNINCGACGTTCGAANAITSCPNPSRVCIITACAAGYTDCNNAVADGCEKHTAVDTANCGSCGVVCNSTNGTATCNGGTCGLICTSGFGNCNGLLSDGCETPTATDTNNCGACGNGCSNANGTASCTAGACSIACATGFGNCDGDVRNGCEAPLNTANNCGTCGTTCSAANATTSCANPSRTCTITTCSPGFGNCDGNVANGCETSIATSLSNCGACGNVCNSTNGTATCSAGSCGLVCNAGFANCNGLLSDGCEVATATTATSCGACGTVCSNNNIATPTCGAGVCNGTCNAGYTDCNTNKQSDGCETHTAFDASNCGTCGNVCPATVQGCANGACSTTCVAGFSDCNMLPADGCEIATSIDVNNCGACGRMCSTANITATCGGGTCNGTCSAGYADCDGNKQTNGCEVHTTVDSNNCGGCGLVCSANHITTVACTNGACTGACAAGFADCDGNKQTNGCEADLQTDASNCGACGTVCAAGVVCSSGVCFPTSPTPPAQCAAGTDHFTGAPWTVCGPSTVNQAWISSLAGGGTFHAGFICRSMGYTRVTSFGGTCGNVCGRCTVGTTCSAPGPQVFDTSGSQGNDAYGPILGSTVMWLCAP